MAALQNTGDSRGAPLWNSTDLILTAKHGQNPRVGVGGLMADSTLPGVIANAGVPVAQATQDDVSLIYLQDPKQTAVAVAALKNFQNNATIDVYFQGTKVTVPASQIIDKILSGSDLVKAGLGDPQSGQHHAGHHRDAQAGLHLGRQPAELHLQAGRARRVLGG